MGLLNSILPVKHKKLLAVFMLAVAGDLWYIGADNYQKQWVREGGSFSNLSIGTRKALGHYVPEGFNVDLARRYNKLTPSLAPLDFPPSSIPVGDGSVSGELEKLIADIPANGNKIIEKLQTLSIDRAETYAQDLINSRAFLDEFKAMKGRSQLELGAAIIFSLRQGGMTDTELEFQAWLTENHKPDQAYLDWLAPRIEKLSDEISSDTSLANNFAQWKKRYHYQNFDDAENQFYLRQNALQNISDKVLAMFGYAPVPVMLSADMVMDTTGFSEEEEKAIPRLGAFAYHNDRVKGAELILVNYFDHSLIRSGESTVQDVEKVMSTILEESKHITDILLMHDLFEGKIAQDDPRYTHALAIYINYSGKYEIVDPAFNKTNSYDEEVYYNQYVERTAKNFAATVKGKILKNNQQTVTEQENKPKLSLK